MQWPARRKIKIVLRILLVLPALLATALLIVSHVVDEPLVYRPAGSQALMALHRGAAVYADPMPSERIFVDGSSMALGDQGGSVARMVELRPLDWVLRTTGRMEARDPLGVWRTFRFRGFVAADQVSLGTLTTLLAIPVLIVILQAWLAIRRRQGRIRRGECLNCGYNLTGLPEPRCPECGLAFATAPLGRRTLAAPYVAAGTTLVLLVAMVVCWTWGTPTWRPTVTPTSAAPAATTSQPVPPFQLLSEIPIPEWTLVDSPLLPQFRDPPVPTTEPVRLIPNGDDLWQKPGARMPADLIESDRFPDSHIRRR
jgi:hypothetical protein